MSSTKRKWDQQGPSDDPTEEPPAKKTDDGSARNAADAAAAAAAIAAKIAAQFSASGAIAPKDTHDAEFTHDIDINDVRNRYLLTKGQTQTEISEETGATVTTKGVWYPDRSKANEREPPLYLHISAHTRESMQNAIDKVNDLLNQELGSLVEDRRRPERRKWPEEKLIIGLDMLRNFNVRAKVVGPGGMFVKYIQSETGTRVQIKGQGSGFVDQETGRESDEPMHIHITGPDDGQVARAKVLTEDLLEVVRGEHAKSRMVLEQSQHAQMYAAYGAYGYQPPQPSDGAPPPPPPDGVQPPGGQPGQAPASLDAFIQYYAAYGYDTSSEQFRDWAKQQYEQTYGGGAAGGGGGAAPAPPDGPAPPPPPSDNAPPPPPPA
ncbi:eukaryotic type KH-domain (KH-domain type I) [Auriculariales sp. MPI-PUGE-AT-0066]|nr:eukaryotic type KH-domain (KH-domain type I) [Auriculariales sp. MPI-PUGE-AT-0066]